MRILTYITTEEDAGRAARSVVPRRFSARHTRLSSAQRSRAVSSATARRLRADTVLRAGQRLKSAWTTAKPKPKPKSKPRFRRPAAVLHPLYRRGYDRRQQGAPLATLPCGHIHTGTLREQLAALLGQDAAAFDYHPVNRLDKGTKRPAVRRPPCPRPAPADRPASHGQLHPRIPRRDRGRSRAARGRDRRADCPPRHGRKTRGSAPTVSAP